MKVSSARGLSCYTAALHGYLAAEWDASALLARSVRLAVRRTAEAELAFSHHEPSLHQLPDGSSLRYAAAGTERAALAGVAAELAGHGRAIVVVDNSRLAWSASRNGASTPHWLLIIGVGPAGWEVTDDFIALLPTGEQLPYHGRLSDAELIDAMRLPDLPPVHRQRLALAFGALVDVPAGRFRWLRRVPDAGSARPVLPEDGWRIQDAEAIGLLLNVAAEDGAGIMPYLDDLWAAAGHRCFACRWWLTQPVEEVADRPMLEAMLARWERLPRLLRIALESVMHGRPRTTLVRTALAELASQPGLAGRVCPA